MYVPTYFTPMGDPKLFRCSCHKCDLRPTDELLETLDIIRSVAGIPMVVTSGPRCPAYNLSIGGVENSEHCTGNAADISTPDSATRFKILKAAFDVGIRRLGIQEHSLHIGIDESFPMHVCWDYY